MATRRAKSHSLKGSSRYRKGRASRRTRRSTVKKRTYRKKGASKKRMINLVATKKRDTMAPLTNATFDPAENSTVLPAILLPGRPIPARTPAYTYVFPWMPTYRRAYPVSHYDKAKLGVSDPYYVGLAERISIQTTGGLPWKWRRVCFTFKGTTLIAPAPRTNTTIPEPPIPIYDTSSYYHEGFDNEAGQFRTMYDLASWYGGPGWETSLPERLRTLYEHIFEGQSAQFNTSGIPSNTDWFNVMDAKTNNKRVTIKYDKTVTISSGNEDGATRTYRRYHPMNRTLQYDVLEAGNTTVTNAMSTESKQGMGDYYVVDFFQARYASDGEDGSLIFDPRATLYWHEK